MQTQTNPHNDRQAAIQRAKQQLQHMIDLLPQMIVLTDAAGTVVRVNRRMVDFLGISEFTDVLDRPLFALFPEMTEEFFRKLLDAPEHNSANSTTIRDSRGEPRQCCFEIINSATESDLFVIVIDDVTDDHTAAAEIERNHKRDAVRALSGALQHHLNQPLTVITVRARLLQQALEQGHPDPEHVQRDLYDILSQAESIGNLLAGIQAPVDFATEKYLPERRDEILDIRESSGNRMSMSEAATRQLRTLTSACNVHYSGYAHHARETSRYAFMIARQMGLGEMRAEAIRRAAFFHDIGKIAIPDAILQKPGGLSDEEMAVMKTHTEAGYHLLQPFPAYADAAEVAWSHHESFDGSGYPRGLSGKEIPLSARIVAVADAFDAMRTKRVYSEEISADTARKLIKEQSGRQFDPAVIEAFGACFNELYEQLCKAAESTAPDELTQNDCY